MKSTSTIRRLLKPHAEMFFWRKRKREEGTLGHDAFHGFFTTAFGLDDDFYVGKRLLDVGCGPRGSLEWADMTRERVGLDPLVASYRKLGIDAHKMTYVESPAEEIPFPDGHFDIVSSMNSLDHVDDLDRAIAELTRVTRSRGSMLLLTEVNHKATFTEPQEFSWEVLDRFPGWRVVWERRSKMLDDIYGSLQADVPADAEGAGLLSALLERS